MKFNSTWPNTKDDERVLIFKLLQFLTSGSSGSMSEHFASTAPNSGDGNRTLLAKILIVMNNGGGGGGGTGVTVGNYGGSAPNFSPSTSGAVAIDSSNGRIWWWYSSAWH